MPGRLKQGYVLVPDQAEANRLYNKGRFGRPQSGGALKLTLAEAAFLVENDRLEVRVEGEGAVPLARLVALAAQREAGFEVEFLVFRDLRERGYVLAPASSADRKREIHWVAYGRGDKPESAEPSLRITVWSERTPARIDRLKALAESGVADGVANVVALVDEESDLTYYDLGVEDPRGATPDTDAVESTAVFLRDRCVVGDAKAAKALHRHGFYGKPVAGGLQLSLVETLHLMRTTGLRVVGSADGDEVDEAAFIARAREVDADVSERLAVYADLRARGLTVKTGFKFGTHFRAYKEDPRGHHAPYLVHVVSRGFESGWPQVSRAVRLSHSVRKTFLFGVLDGARVSYVRLARARP